MPPRPNRVPRAPLSHYVPPPRAPVRALPDPILARVWQASGLRGKPPPVFVERAAGRLGSQPWFTRRVNLDPNVIRDIRRFPLNPMNKRGLMALDVLLHEYAHVNQPNVFPPRTAEAGATDYTGYNLAGVLARMGGVPREVLAAASRIPRPYQQERMEQWKRLGGFEARRFANRGQFGRR